MPKVATAEFTNWKFRLSKPSESAPLFVPLEWLPSRNATATTTDIFLDLLHHSIIPDPRIDQNEKLVQWVGYQTWEYRGKASLRETLFDGTSELVIHGLDTFADVYFNGEHIISTDNMFARYKVKVNDVKTQNDLRIVLRPVFDVTMPYEPADLLGGIASRMFVRKAQYHYGWDWGPTLVTCGVFKPVEIVQYEGGYLEAVMFSHEVEDVKTGSVSFKVKCVAEGEFEVTHTLKKDGEIVWSSGTCNNSVDGELKDVDLWFPHTYGNPHLYTLETTSSHGNISQKVGFRKAELVEDPLSTGTSFFFRINEVDIYCNGCNWIPASNFLTDLTTKDYYDWVELLRDGNQNMLRIWGGGIYESDDLYIACDEMGILVWQDFMFACGQYPGDDKFVSSVKLEAEQNVQRLHNRPSVVIYAGNNEDYQTYEDKHIPDSEFYARKIYEETLPAVIDSVYGKDKMAYIRGSPWSCDGLSASDLTTGDVHQWNVWHGQELPYQEWSKLNGRFVSEFGMQAMPTLQTFKDFITDENEMYPQSQTVEFHNKAAGFERKLVMYVFQNIHIKSFELNDWIYATQLMQSECLSQALLAFRRKWGVTGNRETGGQLVWQINDVYPVTSWAVVDCYKRPKLGYYALKNMSQTLIIGLMRVVKSKDGTTEHSSLWKLAEKKITIDVWVNNLTDKEITGTMVADVYVDGENVHTVTLKKTMIIPNSTTEYGCIDLNASVPEGLDPSACVVKVALHSENWEDSTATDWPQPLKHYPQASKPATVSVNGDSITLSTEYPLKGVYLEVDGEFVNFSDNGFDLFPDEVKFIKAPGLDGRSVRVRHHFSV